MTIETQLNVKGNKKFQWQLSIRLDYHRESEWEKVTIKNWAWKVMAHMRK